MIIYKKYCDCFSWGDNSLKTVSALEAPEHAELRKSIIKEWATATRLNTAWLWSEVSVKMGGRLEMSLIYGNDRLLTTELRVLTHIAVYHQSQLMTGDKS